MAADGTVTIKAILDAAGVTGGIRQIKQGLADVKDAASKVTFEELKTGGTNATALSGSLKSLGGTVTQHVTMPIAGMGAAIFKSASDFDTAASKMAASLNMPKETAEEFSRIGQGIYTNGWGESLGEVNDALSYTAQTLKNTSGNTQEWQKDCEIVTQNALVMADVFGADVSESVRGTNALMEGFGLSAQEASDLMAAGMQRGLNYTDELGDNLSEYSVRWGEAGMSASQYFSLLEAGTANGAYNLDKVGDFLNEFLTSLSDGRMEAGIGAFSQGTQDVFRSFQQGGATAQDVLNAVVGELGSMPDQYQAAQIASETWSSLGEDNAMGMIESLANVSDTFGDVDGAASEMADTMSQSLGAQATSAFRELMAALEPLGEPLVNIAKSLAPVVNGFAQWFASLGSGGQTAIAVILGIVAAIGPLLSLAGTVITVLPMLGGVFAAIASPVGIAIAAVVGAIAAITILWNTSEEFRNAVMAIWDGICQAFSAAGEFIGAAIQGIVDFFVNLDNTIASFAGAVVNFFTVTIPEAFSSFIEFFASIPEAIGTFLQTIIDSVVNWVLQMVQNAYNAGSQFVQTIIDFYSQLPGRVWEFLCSVVSNVANFVSQMIGKAQEVGSQFLGKIVEFYSQLPGRVWAFLSDVIGKAASFVSEMAGKARDAGSQFMSNIVNTLSQIPGMVWNIGSNIVRGIVGGIQSNIGSIANTLLGGVRNAIDNVKSFLGIHSPSRLMRDLIGKNMALGLEIGYERNDPMGAIVDSVKGFASDVKGGFDWYASSKTLGCLQTVPATAAVGSGAVSTTNNNTATNNSYTFSGDIVIKCDDAEQVHDMGELARAIMKAGGYRG